ncbi:Z1 domain-containing protein [Larkinella rosea]|uniref:Putative endonuclease Z1 domain-containing protein n=1 Tax=Larkinella rosea TaxID=2025312 RepID=A0A3P1C147_9BACT|nr:Z1 domain-containing protein [Larkinella rosea]RRB06856.1 hypothetical protein EHT25_03445 [Larkinella rosea]
MNHIEVLKFFIEDTLSTYSSVNHGVFDEIRPQILKQIQLLPGFKNLTEKEREHYYNVAVREYQSVNPIEINPSLSLTKKGFRTWLTDQRKKEMPADYISRYLTYLSGKGRSQKVIDEISSSSEKILSKLGDPRSLQRFYVKGLVVGSVQSGKTGNFNAVINRAIDAGYSLIIVLSGTMEDLRSQTQLRIEEDVIGEGTLDIKKDTKGDKGVGTRRKFGEQGDKEQPVPQVFSITSYRSDFRKSVKESDFSLNNKNILVCKKNTGVLKNLLIWLSEYLNENKEKHDIPFLIVDDEADNASLNNLGKKGVEYASKINGHIRALLDLFTRKTYLGYTATPFANVLQDRNGPSANRWQVSYRLNGQQAEKTFSQVDNIFPDDFIELLSPPSNYVGAKQIFETVLDDSLKLPLVEIVRDSEAAFPARISIGDNKYRAATRDDVYPQSLPQSLKEATQCFILSIALRLSRLAEMRDSSLANPHHTMLVHISRFIPWQNRTKEQLQLYLLELKKDIENDLPNDQNRIYGAMEQVWSRYYANIVQNVRSYLPDGYQDEFLSSRNFGDIKNLLIEAIRDIDVKAVNSETGDRLEYSRDASGNGKKFIAVGGNRLSRGFTLEGLTINYFIRNTNYSDTLLQMGRWFGYRPGYVDCCKLFTTTDAVDKFDSTTRTIEELEVEFIKMNRLSRTPADFVLRVRKHPGTLKITRPSILKNVATVKWSYQDQLVQSTRFQVNNADLIQDAWNAFRSFIGEYASVIEYSSENGFFLINLQAYDLLRFLQLPNTFIDFEIRAIGRFIELCLEGNKLKNWTIAIKATGDGGVLRASETGLTADLKMSMRAGPKKDSGKFRSLFVTDGRFSASGRSANIVASGSDFALLLSESEKIKAEKAFYDEKDKDEKNNRTGKKANIPERVYREEMTDDHGLLVVYLMDLKYIFLQNIGDEEMKEMIDKNGIDTSIPLIGYAIGFPPISPDPGGEYVHGDYGIDEEEAAEEWDEQLEATED